MGQYQNQKWSEYKEGLITSTRIHDISTWMDTLKRKWDAPVQRILDLCLNNSFKGNQSTRYRQQNEDVAARADVAEKQRILSNVRVRQTGFKVMKTHPFIGTSVDRIVECDCCPPRPVEIKSAATMEKLRKGSFVHLPFFHEVNASTC